MLPNTQIVASVDPFENISQNDKSQPFTITTLHLNVYTKQNKKLTFVSYIKQATIRMMGRHLKVFDQRLQDLRFDKNDN